MKTRNVAAVTMAYGEHFIEKWIRHYGSQIGAENLFVISHGASDFHNRACAGVNHVTVPRAVCDTIERHRATLLSDFANALLESYHCVIVADTDELIAVDPDAGLPLKDYLLSRDGGAAAGLGFNIFQPDPGRAIDWSRPVLEQAHLMQFSAPFSKPALRWERCQHTPGGHGLRDRKFAVDENLYLFHLKFCDAAAFGHFDRVAEDFARELGERQQAPSNHIRHWLAGSDHAKATVERWSRRPAGIMAPRDAARGCYEMGDFGSEGAVVQRTGQGPVFSIEERYRALA
ncbi:glycosyltransferase family 2 protein [Mangrovicoccus ximenensis]|uniref:glycosyltransferase family 2 protein n=1 Tax=Mangrovicoccus ximenensis TaxID=1911570 RepID=UPI001374D09D|nr:glycosyltransferase family 2 protein [Mangrovicoccus ximenensis]